MSLQKLLSAPIKWSREQRPMEGYRHKVQSGSQTSVANNYWMPLVIQSRFQQEVACVRAANAEVMIPRGSHL